MSSPTDKPFEEKQGCSDDDDSDDDDDDCDGEGVFANECPCCIVQSLSRNFDNDDEDASENDYDYDEAREYVGHEEADEYEEEEYDDEEAVVDDDSCLAPNLQPATFSIVATSDLPQMSHINMLNYIAWIPGISEN